jgi:hypothetical protein
VIAVPTDERAFQWNIGPSIGDRGPICEINGPICKINVKNTGAAPFMSGFGSNITFKIIFFVAFYPEILTAADLVLVFVCRRAGFWSTNHHYTWDRI